MSINSFAQSLSYVELLADDGIYHIGRRTDKVLSNLFAFIRCDDSAFKVDISGGKIEIWAFCRGWFLNGNHCPVVSCCL